MRIFLLLVFSILCAYHAHAQIVIPGSSSGSSPNAGSGGSSYTVPAGKWARYTCGISLSKGNCSGAFTFSGDSMTNIITGILYTGQSISCGTVSGSATCSTGGTITMGPLTCTIGSGTFTIGMGVITYPAGGTNTPSAIGNCQWVEYSL